MGRLIDANDFRRYAHEQLEGNKTYSADEILEMIDEQPTAYNVEKVVQELVNKRELYRLREEEAFRKNDPIDISLNIARQAVVEYSIEIVKRGVGNECVKRNS